MKSIDVSIIIPFYNNAIYLSDLLLSLKLQTDIQLEIIIVNDGSSSSESALLADAVKSDPRIILVEKSHQGPSAARNTGIMSAKGKWISFADSDDNFLPGIYKHWLVQAEEQHLDMLIGNGFSFNTDTRVKSGILLIKQAWGEILSGSQWIIRCTELEEWPHFVWLQLIRRDIIISNDLHFIPGLLHEDILWTAYLAISCRRIGFCRFPYYGYRHNLNSVTCSLTCEYISGRAGSYIKIINELYALAKKCDPGLRKALIRHAVKERKNFINLLSNKLLPRHIKAELSRQFICSNTLLSLFTGVSNFKEARRAICSSIILIFYSCCSIYK